MTPEQLTQELLRGGGYLHLDNKGNVAGGGYYRVEIIAQLFGVTVRRIQQLTQEGVIPTVETSEGRRYDLVPTIQRYVKYLSDKAYGKSRSEKELELRERKMEAEAGLKESQQELHRLRTDIASGKYVDKEEAKLDYARFFVVFKKFAMSIPSRIAGLLTGHLDPMEIRRIEKDMHGEIKGMLASFVVAGIEYDSSMATKDSAPAPKGEAHGEEA